jgi:hypothetical protein
MLKFALDTQISFDDYQKKIRDTMRNYGEIFNQKCNYTQFKYIYNNLQINYQFCGLNYENEKSNDDSFENIKKAYKKRNVKVTIVIIKCPFCHSTSIESNNHGEINNKEPNFGWKDLMASKNLIINCLIENKTKDSIIILVIDHFDTTINMEELNEYYKYETFCSKSKKNNKLPTTESHITNIKHNFAYNCKWLNNYKEYEKLFINDFMNFESSDKSPYFCENMENTLRTSGIYHTRQNKFKFVHISFQTGKNVDLMIDQINHIICSQRL